MIAEVVSIGTELLLGQIVDTNAVYLAEQLSALGISLYFRTTVGDNVARASATIRQAKDRSDLVILIGGLGPTEDDLTRDLIAAVYNAPLRRDDAIRRHLTDGFARRNYPMPDSILRQADVPEGAEPLPNPNGTAPGLWLEKGRKIVVALPGPPNELIPLFADSVRPRLLERSGGQTIRSKTLRIVGKGESQIEDRLRDLMQQNHPSVAPYAKRGEVHIRVTARADSHVQADAVIAPVVKQIYERLGSDLYGEDDQTLEDIVVDLLRRHSKTVATAESCTGGLLAGRLTNISGSSEVFGTGLITYSYAAKEDLLKIPHALLVSVGAVSPGVAAAMATRAREIGEATFGIGITGIAGPGGGMPEKPVGLVYIALAGPNDDTVQVTKNQFSGSRDDVRYRATQTALDLLRRALLAPAAR